MKLCHLLDLINFETVVWITAAETEDGVYLGEAVNASDNVPGNYLFGDVVEVFTKHFKGYKRDGIGIIVNPYTTE